MATAVADVLFWIAAGLIALAQFFILRSTRRGMARRQAQGNAWLEWSYAIVPAIALVLVLSWTWQTMHNGTVRFQASPHAATVPS